ncbi:MAG: sulfatase-like hydrolase/transferase [Clostridia bacterium]|nr:sulfatase-like hydrolase/transferase [Clostridia bacterium]
MLNDTMIYFQSDNGPSHESRNWLDGREDPYYGGTTGAFTGHKYNLFEGGIRIPAIVSWPGHIPAGRVIDSPHASMDVFPTVLEACGGRCFTVLPGRGKHARHDPRR